MLRLVFSVLILAFSAAVTADAPDGYDFNSLDKAMQQAQQESRLLFVYFGRKDCGYCEKTNKETFIDDFVHEQYSENYVLAYVDSESAKKLNLPDEAGLTEKELSKRHKVSATPVFTFMTPKGKVIYKMRGVQTVEDLIKADRKIQQALSKMASS
jgi:thioredoxin-related protein